MILYNTKGFSASKLGNIETKCQATTDDLYTSTAKINVLTIKDKISIIIQLEISSNRAIAEEYRGWCLYEYSVYSLTQIFWQLTKEGRITEDALY